jgi:hypothetical protein
MMLDAHFSFRAKVENEWNYTSRPSYMWHGPSGHGDLHSSGALTMVV